MLEQVGHRLDREVERLYRKYEAEGLKGMNITHAIEANVDLSNVLKRCAPQWDGGFVICGLTGSGESFSSCTSSAGTFMAVWITGRSLAKITISSSA